MLLGNQAIPCISPNHSLAHESNKIDASDCQMAMMGHYAITETLCAAPSHVLAQDMVSQSGAVLFAYPKAATSGASRMLPILDHVM